MSAFAPYMSEGCNISCVGFGRLCLGCGSWLLCRAVGSSGWWCCIFSTLFFGWEFVVWVSFFCFSFLVFIGVPLVYWVWRVFFP